MFKTERTAVVDVVDADGRPRQLDEFTRFTEVRPLSGPAQWIPGLREYRLGRDACNVRDDGSFEVVRTGEVLRRT